MWEADKIIYKDEGDFIAAYIGDTLMWEISLKSGLKIYISSIEEGVTPTCNGQTLTLGWNTLDLSRIITGRYFTPPLISINGVVISDVSFEDWNTDKISDLHSLMRGLNLNRLNFVGANFGNIERFILSQLSSEMYINIIEGDLDLPKCTTMNSCFFQLNCPNFNVNTINAPLLRDCTNMFKNTTITKVPQIISSNIIYVTSMFSNSTVEEIPIMDFTNVTAATATFEYCKSLTTIGGLVGLKVNVSFAYSPLSLESMINIANTIGDDGATITISSYTNSIITDEIRAMFTQKGWTIMT